VTPLKEVSSGRRFRHTESERAPVFQRSVIQPRINNNPTHSVRWRHACLATRSSSAGTVPNSSVVTSATAAAAAPPTPSPRGAFHHPFIYSPTTDERSDHSVARAKNIRSDNRIITARERKKKTKRPSANCNHSCKRKKNCSDTKVILRVRPLLNWSIMLLFKKNVVTKFKRTHRELGPTSAEPTRLHVRGISSRYSATNESLVFTKLLN